jgi:hypothetical protein
MTDIHPVRHHGLLTDDYLSVCGAWPSYVDVVLQPAEWTATLQPALAPGLTVYDLSLRDTFIGTFTIRAATASAVYLALVVPSVGDEVAQAAFKKILDMFVSYRREEKAAYRDTAKVPRV